MLLIYSIIIIVIVIIVCYKRYQIYHYYEYKFILLYFYMHWDEVKGIEKPEIYSMDGQPSMKLISNLFVVFFCISCIIITKSKIHKFRYMKYKTNLRWTTLIFYIYVSIHFFLTKGICSKNVRQKLKVSLYGPEARLQLVFNILFEIIKFSIIGK